MNKKQKNYAAKMALDFSVKFVKKQKAGQKEHGGNFWEKSGMLDQLERELLDAWAYKFNLTYQLLQLGEFIYQGKLKESQDLWAKIMSDKCE